MKNKVITLLTLSALFVGSISFSNGLEETKASEPVTVGSFAELKSAVESSSSIISLSADITVPTEFTGNYALEVPAGAEITIKGNGHVLSANVTGADAAGNLQDDSSNYSLIKDSGYLTIEDLTIRGGKKTAIEVASFIENAALDYSLKLVDSTIERTGSSSNKGGGILNDHGFVYIENSKISRNYANYGGGMLNEWGTMVIQNSSLNENRSTSEGGGAAENKGGYFLMNNCTVANNYSNQNGGGLHNFACASDAAMTIMNSTIVGNVANRNGVKSGGGLCNNEQGGDAKLNVINSVVQYNYAIVSDDYSMNDIAMFNTDIESTLFMAHTVFTNVYAQDLGADDMEALGGSDGCQYHQDKTTSNDYALYENAYRYKTDGTFDLTKTYKRPAIVLNSEGTYDVPLNDVFSFNRAGCKTYLNFPSDSIKTWNVANFKAGYYHKNSIKTISGFVAPSEADEITIYQDKTTRIENPVVAGSTRPTTDDFCNVRIIPDSHVSVTGVSTYGDTYKKNSVINITGVAVGDGTEFLGWTDISNDDNKLSIDYFKNFALDKSYIIKPRFSANFIVSSDFTSPDVIEYYGYYLTFDSNVRNGEEFTVNSVLSENFISTYNAEVMFFWMVDEEGNPYLSYDGKFIMPNSNADVSAYLWTDDNVRPEGKTLEYTGAEQELIVPGEFNGSYLYISGGVNLIEFTGDLIGAKWTYSLTGEPGSYSEEIPTATEPGEYTIHVFIEEGVGLFAIPYTLKARIVAPTPAPENTDTESENITDLLWLIIVLSVLDLLGIGGVIYFIKSTKDQEKENKDTKPTKKTTKLNTIAIGGLIFIAWQFVTVIVLGVILLGLIVANIICFLKYKDAKKDE